MWLQALELDAGLMPLLPKILKFSQVLFLKDVNSLGHNLAKEALPIKQFGPFTMRKAKGILLLNLLMSVTSVET